jgi:hypothetical protein
VNEGLAAAGQSPLKGPYRQLVSPKLLWSPPNCGLQHLHQDDHRARADRISVLLCCRDNMSTDMPRYDSTVLADMHDDSAWDEAERLLPMLDDCWYHSIDMQQGQLMLMRQNTWHRGVRNERRDARVMKFDLISETSQSANSQQDEFQLLKRDRIAEVCGQGDMEVGRKHPRYFCQLTLDQQAGFTPMTRYAGVIGKAIMTTVKKAIDKGIRALMKEIQ